MLIENGLEDQVHFFHVDALSRSAGRGGHAGAPGPRHLSMSRAIRLLGALHVKTRMQDAPVLRNVEGRCSCAMLWRRTRV